jgi:hypothetical protein
VGIEGFCDLHRMPAAGGRGDPVHRLGPPVLAHHWRVLQGQGQCPVWGLFGVLLLLVIMAVRIDVLLSYYSNDLYSALQAAFQGAGAGDNKVRNSGIHGFWMAIRTGGCGSPTG